MTNVREICLVFNKVTLLVLGMELEALLDNFLFTKYNILTVLDKIILQTGRKKNLLIHKVSISAKLPKDKI